MSKLQHHGHKKSDPHHGKYPYDPAPDKTAESVPHRVLCLALILLEKDRRRSYLIPVSDPRQISRQHKEQLHHDAAVLPQESDDTDAVERHPAVIGESYGKRVIKESDNEGA